MVPSWPERCRAARARQKGHSQRVAKERVHTGLGYLYQEWSQHASNEATPCQALVGEPVRALSACPS